MKTYRFSFSCCADDLLQRVRSLCRENGMQMTDHNDHGTITGLGLTCTYRIAEQGIEVSILKKPLLLPWSLVEQKLSAFFANT